MLGNFTYHNATKVHFGKDALGLLGDELKNYGPKVMLSYGGGSIKRFGIYDQVVKVLREAGKTIIEDGGVLPNPDIEKVLEGARKVREEGVDLILAVGGRLCQGGLGLSLPGARSVGLLFQAFRQTRQSLDTRGRGADHGGHGIGNE